MSDFGEKLFSLLPMHSNLQKKDNPLRKVLDNSVGEWFDHFDVQDYYDNLFLDTATRGYLDRFGQDYGVIRQLGESDDDYRERIIQEKFDKLTPEYLRVLYGVELYTLVGGFNPEDNTLVSDNPYYNKDLFMGVANNEVRQILEEKFILNESILFYEGGELDYIYDTSDNDVLKDYLDILSLSDLWDFFGGSNIKNVKLTLNNAQDMYLTFKNCTGLIKAIINSESLETFTSLFMGCSNLEEVTVNTPNVRYITYTNFLDDCTKLEKINITVPNNQKTVMKAYILGLELQYLTSLIINGEEIDLS